MIKSMVEKLSDYRKVLTPQTIIQITRYLVTGLTAFASEYILFFVLYNKLGIPAVTANIIAMATGFMISFILNRIWSFQSKENLLRQFVMFGVLFAVNLGISSSFIWAASTYAGISPLLSKIIIMCMIVGWNFLIYKKIIYKK